MFDNLSFWEKDALVQGIDHCIIGGGIVGITTALELRALRPQDKIVILERGPISNGASTKNAGFTCFGSVTEILDDLNHMSEGDVIDLIQMRGEGLKRLFAHVNQRSMTYHNHGSVELFFEEEKAEFEAASSQIPKVNDMVEAALGYTNTFKIADQEFGFKAYSKTIENQYEGQIHPVQMMLALQAKAIQKNVIFLNGTKVQSLDLKNRSVHLDQFKLEIEGNIILCTNAFTNQLLPNEDLIPYRNQVMVTKPIEGLNWKRCFHMNKGYIYFRNIGNRVLIGGARNIDMVNEKTIKMAPNERILDYLKSILSDVILLKQDFEIDSSWSGIIATGSTKRPIVRKIKDKIYFAGRSGGMGVAIGSLLGKEMAQRINEDAL